MIARDHSWNYTTGGTESCGCDDNTTPSSWSFTTTWTASEASVERINAQLRKAAKAVKAFGEALQEIEDEFSEDDAERIDGQVTRPRIPEKGGRLKARVCRVAVRRIKQPHNARMNRKGRHD